MTSPVLFSQLPGDRKLIDNHLRAMLQRSCGNGGAVSEAMQYAVLGSGQRIRPLLALRTARLLRPNPYLSLRTGASVEMLHCASLIIDDLPCMDDEKVRRNRPTVHIRFGEPTAILAAFGLVALAARSLVELDDTARERDRLIDFQAHLLRVLDVGGLISGQSLDLALCGLERENSRALMTELKTVPLFVLAVRAGMVFSNAPTRDQEALLEFGRRFGAAFQMTDDLLDGEQDSTGPAIRELDAARCCLKQFGNQAQGLQELVDYLHDRACQNSRSHR